MRSWSNLAPLFFVLFNTCVNVLINPQKDFKYDRNGWIHKGTVPDQKDCFNERHGDNNLAQIIYKMCRGVVPAGLHPFEQDRKQLVEEGMDEETARFITGTADFLFLSQFQAKARTEEAWTDLVREAEEDDDVEGTGDANDADDAESPAGTPSDLNEIQKLKKELSNALKQVKSYKNALAVARQDANSERAKYEHELKELRMEHRELADLRSLVFNRESQDPERIEKVEKQYSYPKITE